MSNIFFTSDTHFGHANIIHYSNRPYSNVEEMNHALIKNWNSKVNEGDDIYHLGDFAFGNEDFVKDILRQLNGNINFLYGNHDKPMRTDSILEKISNFFFLKPGSKERGRGSKYFYNIQELSILDEEMDCKQKIVLCHFPLESWNHMHHGAFHLHGHCHGTLPSSDHQARLDVGVDPQGYYPISYEEVKMKMTQKIFRPIDHHGKVM